MGSRDQIDLTTSRPFRIGPLTVEPALRQVTAATSETLEPRVMQVLVQLAMANGSIVSRDELVRQCWEGRVVGDDVINRVISRLRRLLDDHCGEAVRIETIIKVGYRLIGAVVLISSVQGSLLASQALIAGATSPRSRWMFAVGFALAGAALVAVLAGWAFRPHGGRPIVEVEPFTLTAPGVPAGLVAELRAETADFLANEKFYAVSAPRVPGGAVPDWRIRGTIAPVDDDRRVVVFAELLRHGSEVAVAQLRLDRDVQQPMLARSLGLRIGRTSGCVLLTVTNPELTGGFIESALPALAASCITWHDKTASPAARIESFRDAAAALPKSAYHRARLGELLGDLAADGSAGAATLRTEGTNFVAAAEAIDPTQPHILLARARLLPVVDFAGREALFKRALQSRPSDCACEFGDYSAFLSSVGRNAEARAFALRAREKEPKNVPWLRRAGEAAAIMGDFDAARSELAQVAGYLPDPSNLDAFRMNLGIWSKDWQLAHAMVARQPNNVLRLLQTDLITALESGDIGRIKDVGDQILARGGAGATNDRATVTMLAMSGKTNDAISAAERLLARQVTNTSLLFEPSFAEARRQPAFLSLVTKLGLVDYWRKTGQRPDFCSAPDALPLCATLKRTG